MARRGRLRRGHRSAPAGALVEVDHQPDVTFFESNFYDPAYPRRRRRRRQRHLYVRLAFAPFEGGGGQPRHPGLHRHGRRGGRQGRPARRPDVSGWLLFAQSVKECDEAGTLTRSCVLETAGSVTEWDAGGSHAPVRPSTNSAVECVMPSQVQDGEFVRHAPDEGFCCGGDEAVVDLTGDFSTAGS